MTIVLQIGAWALALRPDEVRRFLWLAASSEMRGSRRVPIAALSRMTGLGSRHLHAIILNRVSAGVRALLAPLIRQIESGEAEPPGD